MTIEITFPQLMTLIAFCLLALAGMGKLLFSQMQNYIGNSLKLLSDRLEAIETSNSEEKEQWKKIERELNDLQKDLPIYYVRREDYIRGQTVLETKMDSLGGKFENVILRQQLGVKNEP